MSLLGLDVGTTGCKAIAFTPDGDTVATAYREYPLYSPQPGWQELDPEEVWQNVREALSEVSSKTKADPIVALAISSQGEACHAIDKKGRCLTRSIVSFDGRTADYPSWWLERIPAIDIARISGMPLHGMYSLNKLMWFKEHCPDAYRDAWKFVCYEDFVHARLGLPPVMSHSLAARTMALDVRQGDWSSKLLDIAGIDRELLPDTRASGEVVGTIPDSVAADLGLPRGITVVTGGHDQPAGALGAGILESGEAIYSLGTVEAICPIFGSFTMTESLVEGNLCCYPACVPGLFASLAFNFTGGSLLKWYRDTWAGAEVAEAAEKGVDVYDLLCSRIPSKPENLLMLPHFTVTGTPYFDTESRGLIAGLTLNTTREEVVSAILSGVTYEMKLNLELLQSSGIQIRRLRAIGGGAKSPIWVQRKADIMGIPIAVLETTEAPALGMAMLAGSVGAGVADVGGMAERAVRISDVFEPEPSRAKAYGRRFELYRQLYPAMAKVNHGLARLESDDS